MPPIRSFPPVAGEDALLLLLGSMPGEASLRAGQYYANPRNAFWPILEVVLGIPGNLPYGERLRALVKCRVALWDVLASCVRETSQDARIDDSTMVPNDFLSFFAAHGGIRMVFFNGAKAEQAYRRHVLPALPPSFGSLPLVRLPSTSPAHAGKTFLEKAAAWGIVGESLENCAANGRVGPLQETGGGKRRVLPVAAGSNFLSSPRQ